MLDFLIYFGVALGLIFLFLGKSWLHHWPFWVSAGIFGLLGIGLLMTGWETYENGDIVINDTNTDSMRISYELKLYPATLEEYPLLFLLGNIFIAFGLGFFFLGWQERRKNITAKEVFEDS